MSDISAADKKKLLKILNELIDTIVFMRKEFEDNYLLQQNEREAIDWYRYLKSHDDKDELDSLSDEIACRLVEKYDDEFVESKWDDKRAELMHKYLRISEKILNKDISGKRR